MLGMQEMVDKTKLYLLQLWEAEEKTDRSWVTDVSMTTVKYPLVVTVLSEELRMIRGQRNILSSQDLER